MGTQERTNERTQAARCFSLLPSTSPSLFLSLCFCRSLTFGRSSLVRSFTRSLARPPSVSLALRWFCIFIDCHLTSPTTVDRGLRQFPHPSRVSLVPTSFCNGSSSSSSIARYEEPLSLFLALFPRYHALRLSFFYPRLSRSLVDPLYALFEASRSFPSLFLTLSCRCLSPSLPALALPAAPWCFYLLRSIQTRWTRQSFRLKLPSGACDIYPHPHRCRRRCFLVLTSTSTSRRRYISTADDSRRCQRHDESAS